MNHRYEISIAVLPHNKQLTPSIFCYLCSYDHCLYFVLCSVDKLAAYHSWGDQALIMGYSHVWWLARFIKSALPSLPGVSSNFAVNGHGLNVEYIGIRRARLPLLHTDDQWERISAS